MKLTDDVERYITTVCKGNNDPGVKFSNANIEISVEEQRHNKSELRSHGLAAVGVVIRTKKAAIKDTDLPRWEALVNKLSAKPEVWKLLHTSGVSSENDHSASVLTIFPWKKA